MQERIPVIMASDPPDATDLCQPLMKELLTVSNAFSIEVLDRFGTALCERLFLVYCDVSDKSHH